VIVPHLQEGMPSCVIGELPARAGNDRWALPR